MTQYSALVGLLVALGSDAALTEVKLPADASALAPTAAADPLQIMGTYDDWVLLCERRERKLHVCEVVQGMVLRGRPVAQIMIGYDKNDLRFTLLVPSAVSLARGPTLGGAGASAPHFDLAWRRCLPGTCFADVAVGSELLNTLRGCPEPMQINFKDAAEHDVALPLSCRGLAQALEALAEEPR